MKKAFALIPLVFALLLSACGNAALQRYESFSQQLQEQDTLSFTAALTASYPDRTVQFELRYTLEDGLQRVTILSPERISGISASIKLGKTALEYDGLSLDTGDLNAYGLSPMSALPLLIEALRHGHADAFWTEDGMDAVELLYDDHARANVWFDGEGLPCRAELISDDVVVVNCEIKNWTT